MFQNTKTCSSPTKLTATEEQNLMMKLMSELKTGDMTMALKIFYPSSNTTVKRCWWNEVEINCNGIFFNWADVSGGCFTFNIGELVNSAGKSDHGQCKKINRFI